MKTYKIYLIRNGLTKGAVEGRYVGHTDEPLSLDGRKQLLELAENYIYPDVDAVISSPLKRCTETAKLLYPGKEPLIIDGIIECNFGEFENKTADELTDDEDFAQWIKGGLDISPPHGESNREFSIRIYNAFIKIIEGILKAGIKETAIVTHGGIIMSWLAAFGLPEAPLTDWRTPCGCGYMIRLDASVWSKINKFEVIDEIPFITEKENPTENPDNFWGDFTHEYT